MPNLEYRTVPFVLASRGLIQRYAADRPPDPRFYWKLKNLECRQENSLSPRLGVVILNSSPLAGGVVHTLARLAQQGGSAYTYAGVGGNLYRSVANSLVPSVQLSSGLSGTPFSTEVFTPAFSSKPLLYIADAATMLKDDGSTLTGWGIDPPVQPPVATIGSPAIDGLAGLNLNVLDDFTSPSTDYTFGGGMVFTSSNNRVNTTLSVAASPSNVSPMMAVSLTPASMAGIVASEILITSVGAIYVTSVGSATFDAALPASLGSGAALNSYYLLASIPGGNIGTISRSLASAADLSASASAGSISLDLFLSDPSSVQEVKVLLDTSDGTFTTGYYWASAKSAGIQAAVQKSTPVGFANLATDYFSSYLTRLQQEQVDTAGNSGVPLESYLLDRRPWQSVLQAQGAAASSIPLQNAWAQFNFPVSRLVPAGTAGATGTDLSHVVAWQIVIVTSAGASVSVGLGSLAVLGSGGGAGLDSTGGAPYTYAITYWNQATGDESNPSVPMPLAAAVNPVRQPVVIELNNTPSDPQVTHWNIYRLGGGSANMTMIAQVPISQTAYNDTVPDLSAALGNALQFDNDPPVTTLLPQPVLLTASAAISATGVQTVTVSGSLSNVFVGSHLFVDTGTDQEEVIVQAVGTNTVRAYFQLTHDSGVSLTTTTRHRQPANLFAIAFGYGWIAGDPNNPHVLYQSKLGQVGSFPPQSITPVGTPGDPIRALVSFRGQLYVFTRSMIYQVTVYPGSQPIPFPLATRHGLAAPFAWALSEGSVHYLSWDGWYQFDGGRSELISEPILWVFSNQAQTVPSVTYSKLNFARMAFFDNEVYFAYDNGTGVYERLNYSMVYRRFRPDSVDARSMLWVKDLNVFLTGDGAGNVYQDRLSTEGDAFSLDANGNPVYSPIAIDFQTVSLDFGNIKTLKAINELTLDLDTAGETLSSTLYFDEMQTLIAGPSLTASGRTQINYQFNEGMGQVSRTFSLEVSGNASSSNITLYQFDIRRAMLAEPRVVWDTFWLTLSGAFAGYKLVKQAWIEYTAQAPVTVNVLLDESSSSAFGFTLPATAPNAIRSVRVRFPASKARQWRFVGTSASDFQVYPGSFVEWKSANSLGGYQAFRFLETA